MNLDRDLPFRGARRYLQSATLFDDILSLVPEGLNNIDFKFHKKTDRQVHYQSMAPTQESAIVAVWRDDSQVIYVVERDEPIMDSVPYDEDALVGRFVFTSDGALVPRDITGFSVMEAIVAAFKAILHRSVVTDKPKVVFVRVRLRCVPGLPLEVKYSRRIGEFFQGDIRVGGESIGQIFFGEWR
jgi:hypothetical protein